MQCLDGRGDVGRNLRRPDPVRPVASFAIDSEVKIGPNAMNRCEQEAARRSRSQVFIWPSWSTQCSTSKIRCSPSSQVLPATDGMRPTTGTPSSASRPRAICRARTRAGVVPARETWSAASAAGSRTVAVTPSTITDQPAGSMPQSLAAVPTASSMFTAAFCATLPCVVDSTDHRRRKPVHYCTSFESARRRLGRNPA